MFLAPVKKMKREQSDIYGDGNVCTKKKTSVYKYPSVTGWIRITMGYCDGCMGLFIASGI